MRSNFDDVGEFHRKFDLPNVAPGYLPVPHTLDRGAQEFRLKFLIEELREYAAAVGYRLQTDLQRCVPFGSTVEQGLGIKPADDPFVDLPGAADALIDLAYVVLGTAHMHHLPWQDLWNEVQRANVTKERCQIGHVFEHDCYDHPGGPECDAEGSCTGPGDQGKLCGQPRAKHGPRGSSLDVIKPPGWKPPAIARVLSEHGWRCDGNHADPPCLDRNCWRVG